jgi:signal transduction histidine kinase
MNPFITGDEVGLRKPRGRPITVGMGHPVEARGPGRSGGRPYPVPTDEPERLRALRELAILDTAPEASFDDLTALAAEICGTPMALVSLVDERRQWFKSAVGLPTPETPRDVAFCAHAIVGDGLFVVPDARADERFADNPLVTGDPNLRFYAGAPLRTRDEHCVGTLCVLDRVPRALRPGQVAALEALARQVEALIELRARLREAAAHAEAMRAKNEVLARTLRQRDRLTRFMVHDLKSLLSVVSANAGYLLELPDTPAAERAEIVRDIAHAAGRLHGMVLDALDLQLAEGGSIPITRAEFDLAALVQEVARGSAPASGRRTTVTVGDGPVRLDADRAVLARVIENLLDNARKYGEGLVELDARSVAGGVEVRVRDDGPGIEESARARVFEPYVRLHGAAASLHSATSRGLGLAFCRAAVEAHGGRIWIEDAQHHGSVFCFALPAG